MSSNNNYGPYDSPANQTPSATQTFLSDKGTNVSQQGVVKQTVQPQIDGVSASAVQWNNTGKG
jgi:hypothetical protein